jgi:endoglucanase
VKLIRAGVRRGAATVAVGALALAVGAGAATAEPPRTIRVGGPSALGDAKVAIVGSGKALGGKRYDVLRGGTVVQTGTLRAAPGKPAPWPHAYRARLDPSSAPGTYRVRVPALGATSPGWVVRGSGSGGAIDRILEFFAANRDGNEHSPIHGAAHLHDATVKGGPHDGSHLDLTGGWMDAGDMIHFAQTTAFATALLEASARLDPARRAELDREAGVGIRWLVKAHPAPNLFIGQVGDARDHDAGFRDPARDDASHKPGIGHRLAYPGIKAGGIGGDIAGKAAAALALAYDRTGSAAFLSQAKQWYAAGTAAHRSTPSLPGGFYHDGLWRDSMAAGAAALYRSTGEQHYLDDAIDDLRSSQSAADGTLGVVDSFASFAAADLCGALGAPALGTASRRSFACRRLDRFGQIAVDQARGNAFGMPGFFTWGTTAQNGASGALAELAGCADGLAGGRSVAAGARDYMLGRNPFGRSFVVGYGPLAPRHPHHWASVFGDGLPRGAVVGGPAPVGQVHGQGFQTSSPFDSKFATYEDRRADYVTSEPALDYAASSVLLLATLEAGCPSAHPAHD